MRKQQLDPYGFADASGTYNIAKCDSAQYLFGAQNIFYSTIRFREQIFE